MSIFASVFTKNVSEKLPSSTFKVNNSVTILEEICLTDDEVLKTIAEFKELKSPGVDGITSTYAFRCK